MFIDRQPHHIRAWRLARGMSLEALGHAVGMTKGNLSTVERFLKPYTQHTLERIAAELKVTPAELLARPPAAPRDLWAILDGQPEDVRRHVAAVAEAMLEFRPAPALDELLEPQGQSKVRRSTPRVRASRTVG